MGDAGSDPFETQFGVTRCCNCGYVMENLPVNHIITVREGPGETRRVPFAR